MQALEQKELERQLRDKELQLRRAQQAQEDAEAEAAALRAELGPQGENQGYVDEELARLTLTTYCLPTSYLLPTTLPGSSSSSTGSRRSWRRSSYRSRPTPTSRNLILNPAPSLIPSLTLTLT